MTRVLQNYQGYSSSLQ